MRLMTFGETSVGIITGSSQVLCHTDRIRGFCDNIAARYPQIRVLDTIENSDDEFESYEKTLALLKRYPQINALYFTAGGYTAAAGRPSPPGGTTSASSLTITCQLRRI